MNVRVPGCQKLQKMALPGLVQDALQLYSCGNSGRQRVNLSPVKTARVVVDACGLQLYRKVGEKMAAMQKLNMSFIEVQFLRKAVDVLCRCRQTLMYTYVFAYYLRKNNQSIIFEVRVSVPAVQYAVCCGHVIVD